MPTKPDTGAVISLRQVDELLELLERALDYSQRPHDLSYTKKIQWHHDQANEVCSIVVAGRLVGNVPWMVNQLRALLAAREPAAAVATPPRPHQGGNPL